MNIRIRMISGEQYEFDVKSAHNIEFVVEKLNKHTGKFVYFGPMVLNVNQIESVQQL